MPDSSLELLCVLRRAREELGRWPTGGEGRRRPAGTSPGTATWGSVLVKSGNRLLGMGRETGEVGYSTVVYS
jgi:hypothetical protein